MIGVLFSIVCVLSLASSKLAIPVDGFPPPPPAILIDAGPSFNCSPQLQVLDESTMEVGTSAYVKLFEYDVDKKSEGCFSKRLAISVDDMVRNGVATRMASPPSGSYYDCTGCYECFYSTLCCSSCA